MSKQITQIKITFKKTRSPNFDCVVSECQKSKFFQIISKNNQKEYISIFPITEIYTIEKIVNLAGSWKSFQMFINDEPASKTDLRQLQCYKTRQKSLFPEKYCFGSDGNTANIWGCKKLGMNFFRFSCRWLNYGFFDKNGVWYFDKEKIKQSLQEAINKYKLCPVLDEEKIFKTLENFPDSIDPKKDPDWKYLTAYEVKNGVEYEIADGVFFNGDVSRYILSDTSDLIKPSQAKPLSKKETRFVVNKRELYHGEYDDDCCFDGYYEDDPSQDEDPDKYEDYYPKRSSRSYRRRNSPKNTLWWLLFLVFIIGIAIKYYITTVVFLVCYIVYIFSITVEKPKNIYRPKNKNIPTPNQPWKTPIEGTFF